MPESAATAHVPGEVGLPMQVTSGSPSPDRGRITHGGYERVAELDSLGGRRLQIVFTGDCQGYGPRRPGTGERAGHGGLTLRPWGDIGVERSRVRHIPCEGSEGEV